MYFAGVQPHDIALVKLPRAVPFTPACLPRSSPRVGSSFEIAGWGKIDAHQERIS